MTGVAAKGRQKKTAGSGDFVVTRDEATPDAIASALTSEAEIGTRATRVRGDATELTPELFLRLYPLLCEPIPTALITKISKTKGKPYDSTGLRSVQVQVDRMNAVLTPLWWSEQTEYSEGGKLAEVTVRVGATGGPVLAERSSHGGVDRGSTIGNVYKGSYTNAAKLAFARLGVGHEVYVGAADLDPDTDAGAAQEQARGAERPAEVATIPADRAAGLRDRFDAVGVDPRRFKTKLGALGVAGARSVNQGLAALTPAQAVDLELWMNVEADRAAEAES